MYQSPPEKARVLPPYISRNGGIPRNPPLPLFLEKMSLAELDLSHHLSELAKARKPSFLKKMQKYWMGPGLISLGGGLPSPQEFPFSSIGATISSPNSLLTDITKGKPWTLRSLLGRRQDNDCINIQKYSSGASGLELAGLLQYSSALGHPVVRNIIKEFTEKVYQPKCPNYATLVHNGNTDAWDKALLTLCNPGDGVLVGEWTFPPAINAMEPYNIKPVPVSLDEEGICPDNLRKILSGWDESSQDMKRPRVLYTIPTGQNPTGAMAQIARKQAIYDICVEFDVIIVEDDPYYFLQLEPYVERDQRSVEEKVRINSEQSEFLGRLTPSYLSLDHQGRVIRLDTFSKVIAPGCRLGWFTCAPIFAERLELVSEVTTQAPCGFAQALVSGLLLEWGLPGYLQWLEGLPLRYQKRRDFMLDCFHEEFRLVLDQPATGAKSDAGPQKYVGYMRTNADAENRSFLQPLISLSAPISGMFIWITVYFEHHPSYPSLNAAALEMKLFESLANAKVIFCPGQVFAADPIRMETAQEGHLRISFSSGEEKDVRKAIQVFASTLESFFSLETK